MSNEFIRRTLNSRLGGSANMRPYVEALNKYLLDLEEKSGKEISYINYPQGDILPFGFSEEEALEAYDWVDPYKDEKKKPAGYEPPTIKHRPATTPAEASGGGWKFGLPGLNFDILWFCIVAVWLGLVVFGGILLWFIS